MSSDITSIMVIEDNTLLLQAITTKFSLLGISTVSCVSSTQALEYLTHLDELPDAIWIDYNLKDKNCLDFANVLKQNPKWENLTLAIVNNSSNPDTAVSVLALHKSAAILKAEQSIEDTIHIINQVRNERL